MIKIRGIDREGVDCFWVNSDVVSDGIELT